MGSLLDSVLWVFGRARSVLRPALGVELLGEDAEARRQDGVLAVLDQGRTRIPEDLLDWVLARGAGAAEQLERLVDDLHCLLRHGDLASRRHVRVRERRESCV